MKKYDYSDKKLRRSLLASEIFLTLVCISPILGIVIEHHSDIQLLRCVGLTAVMTAIIALSWAFYFAIENRDEEDKGKEKNNDSSG